MPGRGRLDLRRHQGYALGFWRVRLRSCSMCLCFTEELENPAELFSSLRSGAFLCQLMNELMCDDLEFDPFPEDVAVERQNVETFIKACTDLGLEVVFVPDDLIELGNVRLVLETLVKLAEAAV